MSDDNWITPEKPVYVLCNPPAEDRLPWGLLWGSGDVGRLDAKNRWAVVRVTSYREIELSGRHCVEFENYQLIFEGERVEAVNTLISLGVDPARITPEIKIEDAGGVAITGCHGTSVAAGDGFADTGAEGYAEAGARGIARTGEAGYAKAGEGGLAIVEGRRFGTALAGDRGIAIGEERFKYLSAGDGGIAIAINGKVEVGNQGIGIIKSGEWVSGGHESIVIGELVSGGPESVLIARKWIHDPEDDKDERQIACGIVGRDGIEPWVQYTVRDRVLVRLKETSDE